MLAASPDRQLSMASPSSRKRLAVADIPTAKRPKTASTASLSRTVDSTIASQFEARRRRAAGWLGVNNGSQDSALPKPIARGEGADSTRTELESTAANVRGTTDASAPPLENLGPTAPTPALLAQINATHDKHDSRQASDDFRSVIDDLTVQNKKLKTKLRKYARLHSAHLQKEKLFEIKVHEGLPAHKKRELEETLRSFAASIDNESTAPRTSSGLQLSATTRSPAMLNASSSSTSDSKVVDSAYASGSMSGNMLSRSNSGQQQVSRARDNKIKSYLDEIPETLYPSKSPTLSEQAKSKLVVRRLEQIFTGRGAATHSHNHSRQQQDVSDAAAEHERSKLMAGGLRVWQEGTREAQILPQNTDLREDPMEGTGTSNHSHGSNDCPEPEEADPMSPSSPEQRPTRPLDLDIHRAQVPSENMEYIRHLGAPSPKHEGSMLGDENGGWVYLNLLVSMAQVHTVNVTPEFIRKAVQNYSQKMELSKDGTMIRWLGGTRGSRLSSAGDDPDGQWKSSESSGSVSKKGSTDELSSNDPSGVQTSSRSGARRSPQKGTFPMDGSADSERFQYKPILLHRTSSAEEENSGFDSDSPASTNSMEYATGINSSSNALQGQARLKGRKHDNGPIIFYHRAKFCTDLGGDPALSGSNVAYNRFIEHPVGSPIQKTEDHPGIEQKDHSSTVGQSSPMPSRSALDLGDLATSISDCASQSMAMNPVDMEASGLGGIHPTDNFIVKVQTRHHPSKSTSRKMLIQKPYHRLPVSNLSAFKVNGRPSPFGSKSSPSSPLVKAEIISAIRSDLPPSTLPPPSYGMPQTTTSESSSSESDDSQSSLSSASARAARFNPRHMPHHINPSTAFQQSPTSDPPAANKHPLHKSAPLPRRSQHAHPIKPCLLPNLSTSTEETKESSPSPSDGFKSEDETGKKQQAGEAGGAIKKPNETNNDVDDDDEDDDDDGDDDDDSIDLLCHARLQDPAAVERQEREMRAWQREQEEGEESVSVAATGGESDEDSMDNATDEEGEDEDDDQEEGRSIDSMSIERGELSA